MRLIVIGVLAFVSGCATVRAHDPFRNADGSLNVPKILEWVGFGLDADCAIPNAIAQDVCAIGKPALATAQAAADHNPSAAATSAGQSLQATLNALPAGKQSQLSPYFTWAIKLLEGLSA